MSKEVGNPITIIQSSECSVKYIQIFHSAHALFLSCYFLRITSTPNRTRAVSNFAIYFSLEFEFPSPFLDNLSLGCVVRTQSEIDSLLEEKEAIRHVRTKIYKMHILFMFHRPDVVMVYFC